MPTLRRESAGSLQPKTLLESGNPYESRRLTVEYDGVTTAAYLHDATTTVAATWIANHVPAPAGTDVTRIESGQAPIMPAGHTTKAAGGPAAVRTRHARAPVVRRGRRRGRAGERQAAGGHPGLVGREPGHARLQPGHRRPDPLRLVPGRRHGGPGGAGGTRPGLLEGG